MFRGVLWPARACRWVSPYFLQGPSSAAAAHATAGFATTGKHAIPSDIEVVIGVELHVQINSATKLFSRAPAQANLPPNTAVSMFDAALPGTLPAINRACVEAAIRTGLSVGGTVQQQSHFERKHYFYPDLPHGYQITQNDRPIVIGGWLTLPASKSHPARTVRIKQIQLEMDTGKSSHEGCEGARIDLNRAGSALMEIVSEPDLRSGEEAASFVRVMQHRLRHIGTSDGNLEDGSLRADVNVSVRSRDGTRQSARCELKNLNSLRSVARAVDYEAKRHAALLLAATTETTDSNGARINGTASDTANTLARKNTARTAAIPFKSYRYNVTPGGDGAAGNLAYATEEVGTQVATITRKETRSYDPVTNTTSLLRSKEDALDYMFMPEPDLPPLIISDEELAALTMSVPEPPEHTTIRLCQNYGISPALATQLVADRPLLLYFERVMEALASCALPTPALQGSPASTTATKDASTRKETKPAPVAADASSGSSGTKSSSLSPETERAASSTDTQRTPVTKASGRTPSANVKAPSRATAGERGASRGDAPSTITMGHCVLPPPAGVPYERLPESVTLADYDCSEGAVGADASGNGGQLCDAFSMSVAKWVVRDVASAAKALGGRFLDQPAVAPERAAQLLRLVASGTLSERMAKEVWAAMVARCDELAADGGDQELPPVEKIVEELFKGGGQVTDQGEIEVLCREIIAGNPKEVAAVRAGKTRILGFFVGQLMKQMAGRADPQKASELFSRLIAEAQSDR